jgi:CDP-diacylglycerol--glycerol-3-phosphate 3-phosphatidyltransferase
MQFSWTIPNALTVARVPLLLAILFMGEWPFPYAWTMMSLLLFLAMISDFLDGYLARLLNQVSDFGKVADPLLDKIFVLGLFIWMLSIDLLPGWCTVAVVLVLGRELAVTGLRGGASSAPFAADWYGKWKTTFQFACLVLLFLGRTLEADYGVGDDWTGALKVAGLISFWIAAVLALVSGWRYFRRYA